MIGKGIPAFNIAYIKVDVTFNETTLKTQQDETSTTNSGAYPGPGRLLFSEEAIQSSPSSGPSCASPSFRW
jgi:phosphate transport system permease protein